MIHRIYTWRVPVPEGRDADEVVLAAVRAAERIAEHNPNVEAAWIEREPDGALAVAVHFTGRDQWWIKKRVVYAIGGILAQSKLPVPSAKLIEVTRPQDRRSTRERASDGRHNPLPDHVNIDHSDLGLLL